MKKSLLSTVTIAVLGLLFSSFVFAQDDKMVSAVAGTYIISAKAGGVNYVEGKVSIVRKEGKSGLLLKTDSIEIGDKILTGADGKAEILLNPGSFLRLGANSEFEFQTTNLDNLQLKLSSGSAIFEVYADNEFKVTIDLPGANIELTKSGVYRVDVLADGSGKISVRRGKFVLGDEEVKAGRTAFVKNKLASGIAKFDRDNMDALDVWSQFRGKEAAAINKRLQRNALSNSLLGSYNRGGWNMFNTFGVWVFDSFTGRWCFLPFGQGWSSPYGYDYGFNIYHCSLPPVIYTPPPTPASPATGQMTPAQAVIREARRESMQTPTFQRFENNNRSETRGGGGSGDSQNNGGGWNNNRSRDDSSDSRSNDSRSNDSRSNDSRPTFTPSTPSAPSTPAPSSVPDPAPNSPSRTKDN
ncbi:MAG TPA: FecR family protein [Pyrinomonadaceae bacterium]|jgi:hypothetical protein